MYLDPRIWKSQSTKLEKGLYRILLAHRILQGARVLLDVEIQTQLHGYVLSLNSTSDITLFKSLHLLSMFDFAMSMRSGKLFLFQSDNHTDYY